MRDMTASEGLEKILESAAIEHPGDVDQCEYCAALAHADTIRNAVKLAEGLEALANGGALVRVGNGWTVGRVPGWQHGAGIHPTPEAAVEAARAALEVPS